MDEEETGLAGINMTPLVDVSLALVMIFMVTMPMSMIHGITVRKQILKQYGLTTPQETVTVHLKTGGIFILDERSREKAVPYEKFGMVLSQLMQISPSKKLLLRSERAVPHGQTVWVLDLAKQNGAEDISVLESRR